ncbi:MAG: zinc ribbon domain-containing protein [Clostridiales bacterium]|nr:zinc ribbon domain-containing protein [Clostridiales bacterium]
MIVCQNCGTKNNDNFNCCYNCGTPLPKNAPAKEVKEESEEKKPRIMPLVYDDDEVEEIEEIEDVEEAEALDEDIALESEDDAQEYSEEAYEQEEYAEPVEEEDTDGAFYTPTYVAPRPKASAPKKNKPAQQKDARFEINISKLIKWLVLILLALMCFFGVKALLNKLFGGTPGTNPSPTPPASSAPLNTSDFDTEAHVFSEYDSDSNKIFTIEIFTTGAKVAVLNNEYDVVDGKVTVSVSELDVYRMYRPSDVQAGQTFDTKMPIVVMKQGYQDYTYEVTINGVATPMAPYELLSPSAERVNIYSTNTTISFKVDTASKVFINNQDYTQMGLDASTGVFSLTLTTAIAEEPHRYKVKIETPGYMTREIVFELTRTQSWDPDAEPTIEMDQNIWTADDNALVTVRGTFMGNPDDLVFIDRYQKSNTVGVEVVSLTFSDTGDGRFEAVLKCNKLGWIDVSVECSTNLDYTDSILVQCLSSTLGGFDKYATSCKDVLDNYNRLGSYNGDRFVTYGSKYAIITEIVETENGYAFYATLNGGTEDQRIYVETCKDAFTYEVGRKVVVHGNLCGNKDGVPRFIAVRVAAK